MDSQDNVDTSSSEDLNSSSNSTFIRANPEKCLARAPSLSKVDGLESGEIEVLNGWFLSEWRKIYSNNFTLSDALTRDFTVYLESKSSIAVDLEKADAYLSVQKLLYNGLRLELPQASESGSENVSQCKLFHRYYYSCRENPVSLNNLVVLSNVIWSLKKFRRDEFALTCLVDVLLQSYMVALDTFIGLGGVNVLRETFEYLAQNGRLTKSTNFLLKCMDLLDKLDINFKVLQTSKIGVPVNCIALSKSHSKLNYECGNDKVKLRATNLIKKWKAIRDAAMPNKPATDPEAKFKRAQSFDQKMAEKAVERRPGDLKPGERTAEKGDRKLERERPRDDLQANEPEGSFVLNIINTMVEQKEREKKRKLEIRNSQMSKFKSNSTDDSKEDVPEKAPETKEEKPKVAKEPKEVKKEETPKAETEGQSTNQLASLMNFFKEYSNKTGDKPAAQPQPVASTAAQAAVTPKNLTASRKADTNFETPTKTGFEPAHKHSLAEMGKRESGGHHEPKSNFSNEPPKYEPPKYEPPRYESKFSDAPKYNEPPKYEPVKYPEPAPRMAPEQPPIFSNFPVLGQVLPPGFIPPPPPPPPAPPMFMDGAPAGFTPRPGFPPANFVQQPYPPQPPFPQPQYGQPPFPPQENYQVPFDHTKEANQPEGMEYYPQGSYPYNQGDKDSVSPPWK